MIVDYDVLLKLFVSLICAGIIGIERETQNKAGGFRTHILVGVGSTLIMIVSMGGATDADQWRLAAQVVSGIGFLGTGTILRDKSGVSGLTTAASLWVTAGIGLAIGANYYFASAVTTVLVLFSLVPLGFFTNQLSSQQSVFIISCDNSIGLLGEVSAVFAESKIDIEDINITHHDKRGRKSVELQIKSIYLSKEKIQKLTKKLYHIEEVLNVDSI